MLKMLEPAIAKRVSEVAVICDRSQAYTNFKQLLEQLKSNNPKLNDNEIVEQLNEVLQSIVEASYRSGFKDGMYVIIKME